MPTQPNTQPATEGQNFVTVLSQIGRGAAVAECSGELRRLIEQIEQTGKGGSLTLKLNIAPHAKVKKSDGDGSYVLDVDYDVQVKVPRPGRPGSIFYATASHDLVRNDPYQRELSFGVVEGGAAAPAAPAPAPSAKAN